MTPLLHGDPRGRAGWCCRPPLGQGGELFVLDMGEPVRIVDLAERPDQRAGLRPGEDVPIAFTGVRPGEKLFEELAFSDEMVDPDRARGNLRVGGEDADWQAAPGALETLERHALDGDDPAVRAILAEGYPAEYRTVEHDLPDSGAEEAIEKANRDSTLDERWRRARRAPPPPSREVER